MFGENIQPFQFTDLIFFIIVLFFMYICIYKIFNVLMWCGFVYLNEIEVAQQMLREAV